MALLGAHHIFHVSGLRVKIHVCDILVNNPADKEQLGSDKKSIHLI